jgi:NAD(P)-dependent dehydrogenase (short-subunit alcohol dehydrogenase family)
VSTIVVTGAASGIGAATKELLEAGGNQVIGVDLRGADITADLATPDGRGHAIESVISACGGVLDGLVTCAGLAGAPSRAGSVLVAVNYFGTVEILDGLRSALSRGTEPSAVAISSNSTTCQPAVPPAIVEACLAGDEQRARTLADAAGSLATYPATKTGVARWVRRHAVTDAWIGSGVRLNAVAPGMIETPMIAEGRADPEVAPMLDLFPLPIGRTGRATEIAALLAFLLSPAASFFCGSIVFADGGTDALLRADDWPSCWEPDARSLAALFGSRDRGG